MRDSDKSNWKSTITVVIMLLLIILSLFVKTCKSNTVTKECFVEELVPLSGGSLSGKITDRYTHVLPVEIIDDKKEDDVRPSRQSSQVSKKSNDASTDQYVHDTQHEPLQGHLHQTTPDSPVKPDVPVSPVDPTQPGGSSAPSQPEDPIIPPSEDPPVVPRSHAALEWMLSQLATDGTTIYDYFAPRNVGTSLDSTGLNFAPIVNAEMIAAVGGIDDADGFGWRIIKGDAQHGDDLYFSEGPVENQPVGTVLDDVAATNTIDTTIVDGSARVGEKTVDAADGSDMQIEIITDFVADAVPAEPPITDTPSADHQI